MAVVTEAPAAMIAAAVSCRARWKRMPAASSPSIRVTTSPPGMPNSPTISGTWSITGPTSSSQHCSLVQVAKLYWCQEATMPFSGSVGL